MRAIVRKNYTMTRPFFWSVLKILEKQIAKKVRVRIVYHQKVLTKVTQRDAPRKSHEWMKVYAKSTHSNCSRDKVWYV